MTVLTVGKPCVLKAYARQRLFRLSPCEPQVGAVGRSPRYHVTTLAEPQALQVAVRGGGGLPPHARIYRVGWTERRPEGTLSPAVE